MEDSQGGTAAPIFSPSVNTGVPIIEPESSNPWETPESTNYATPTIAEILLAEHEKYLAGFMGNPEEALQQFIKEKQHTFLSAVRLDDYDGESLLIDTGAYDGLGGEEWFAEHLRRVHQAGMAHLVTEKPTSVVVSGVGKTSEQCKVVQGVPGVLEDGTEILYSAPKIPGSSVPALCGMQTLDEHNLGVLPWSNQLVKVPKGKEHLITWPQGTTFLQCRRARTGHLMLPIGYFNKASKSSGKDRLAFTADSRITQQFEPQAQSSPTMSVPQGAHAPSAMSTVIGR